MFRALLITIAVALAALVVATAVSHVNSPAAVGPRTSGDYIMVEDFAGRSVRVPTAVRRVVAVGPGALRLLMYLNASELLVGVEELEHGVSLGRDYSMAYRDVLRALPAVGPGGPRAAPDPERLRSVRPDLVVMSSTYVSLYDPDRLSEEVGAPILIVDYGPAGYLDLDSLKNALRLLGKVLGRERRAEELCRIIDGVVEDLSTRTRDIPARPTVYVGAISYKGKQPFTASQAHFPPLELLSTASIADGVGGRPGFVPLDFEYILSAQPDFVFIDLNNLDVVLEDFTKDPAKYCGLKAFREGRVYSILPFNYYHTNVATALANAYYMGKVLYPERFADVDPEAKADEIFAAFLGRGLYKEFVEGFGRGFGPLSDLLKCSR